MAKKAATPRTRKKKTEPKSKGLSPAECREVEAAESKQLTQRVESLGGEVLATYREPLGGRLTALAALPIDKVSATPFQRDLSETHAKRLTDTIGKLGQYIDPVVAVASGDQFWTPNGRHRLEALTRLGARTIMALVLPDAEIQYKILALNIEKAHNLKERSLEVIRMYRSMAEGDGKDEESHQFEFEEPSFITLGVCYEHNGRFGGGAYHPILRRVDDWLEGPFSKTLAKREARAAKIEALDARVAEIVAGLKEKGFQSPYLKAFVVSRVNPLRFMKTMPSFDDALDDILQKATKFNISKVKQEDIAASAGPVADDDGG